ncbi:MAG: aldehyde dehydrogenase family protein [Pseudomonadota bacterium]
MIERTDFFIDGQWIPAHGTDRFTIVDPSTEEPYAQIALGNQTDTDAAVAAARRAFPGWAATPVQERIALAERILDVYRTREDEVAEVISHTMGAPIDFSKVSQSAAGAGNIKDAIDTAKKFRWSWQEGPADHYLTMDPVGVVGMITPWNWPISQVTLKVLPALIAGCTMVLKPSEYTPLDAVLFAEMIDAAGVPAGVFNLVNGDGPGVGTALSTHTDIDMISFTGSTRAGIAITKAAADTLKRVRTELGGKGANIVFEDADPEAVRRGVATCFNNTGQSCNSPTRMLVQRSIYDDAVEMAREAAERTVVGSGHESGRHIGPLVSERQYGRVQALIEKGIAEGARLVAGGPGRPEGFNRGFFVRPTVFADVTNEMTIAREEIFGPVLSMIPFETEDEAIAIANDTPYGLENYVQSQDGEKRNRVARQLRSGVVEMNGRPRGAGAPFGGFKWSGNSRESGTFGLEEYLEVKSISGWAAE